MLYALLIYEDETVYPADRSGPVVDAVRARHMAFIQELGPRRLGGCGLKGTATATSVRTEKGAVSLHDGPFAEAKEQLGGFYLIDVPDLDAALALARKVPLAKDGTIEVRPVIPPPPQ